MEEGNTSKHHLSLVSWSRDSLVSSKCHLPLASLSGARSVSMAVGETGVSLPCTLRDPRQPFLSDEAVRNHVETRVSLSGGAQVEPRKGRSTRQNGVPYIPQSILGTLAPMGQSTAPFSPLPIPRSNSLCAQLTLKCQCLSFFLSFFQCKGRQSNILSLDAALKGHPVCTLDFRWGHFQLIQTNRDFLYTFA